MIKTLRLVPNNTQINFIGLRVFAFIFSAILFLGALGVLSTKGLNFGIDFTGGTLIEIKVDEEPSLAELRSELNTLNIGNVSIQEFGSSTDLLIRLPEQVNGAQGQQAAINAVQDYLNEKYNEEGVEYRRTEFVGPQVGDELIRAGVYAVIFSLLGIMIYVSIRFEWQFGLASLIALFHDIVITTGFFALTGAEFNLATVAALLMVGGYSINDTVVVFDRIRENLRKFKKQAVTDTLNLSVNQTLSRTVLTSLTTLLALLALYFFGGEVIQGFILALIFGIVIGTYSSIFIAGSILAYLKPKRANVETAASSS